MGTTDTAGGFLALSHKRQTKVFDPNVYHRLQ